jgi:hypothetical protein
VSALILPFAAKPRRRASVVDASAPHGRVISFDAPHLRLALLWKRRPVMPSTLDELDISRAADTLALEMGKARARAGIVTPADVVAYYERFGAAPYVTPAGEVKISNVGLAFVDADSETAEDRVTRHCMTQLLISDRAFKSSLVAFLRETRRTVCARRLSARGHASEGSRS